LFDNNGGNRKRTETLEKCICEKRKNFVVYTQNQRRQKKNHKYKIIIINKIKFIFIATIKNLGSVGTFLDRGRLIIYLITVIQIDVVVAFDHLLIIIICT
jgi:hypothetical protein